MILRLSDHVSYYHNCNEKSCLYKAEPDRSGIFEANTDIGIYHSKQKHYFNMIQKQHHPLLAKADLKWTDAKWKTVHEIPRCSVQ